MTIYKMTLRVAFLFIAFNSAISAFAQVGGIGGGTVESAKGLEFQIAQTKNNSENEKKVIVWVLDNQPNNQPVPARSKRVKKLESAIKED